MPLFVARYTLERMPMTILGAVLSLAVIYGAVALIRELRRVNRCLKADLEMAKISVLAPIPGPGRSRLAVVTTLRRRIRAPRLVYAAWAGLAGVLGTAAVFVIADPHSTAPVAEWPPATQTTTAITTVRPGPPTATITIRGQVPAAVTVVTTAPRASVIAVPRTATVAPVPSPAHSPPVNPSPGGGSPRSEQSSPPPTISPGPSIAGGPTTSSPTPVPSVSVAVDPN